MRIHLGNNEMTFEELKTNVEQWAEARGIYEHSTPLAQALKAVSEVGELADAVIKGDREALKDAIGDVAVCIVNYAAMMDEPLSKSGYPMEVGGDIKDAAWTVAMLVTGLRASPDVAPLAICALALTAEIAGLTLEECCAAAWNEIKGRKGRMVPGGAFVKEVDA